MITAWNSFSQLDRLFDQVVNDVMGKPVGGSLLTPGFTPSVDVRSSESELCLSLDVPGLKQEDLELNVENGVLTIKGERKYNGSPEERAWLGRRYGAFTASYALPDYVDTNALSAQLSDGVLTIRAPKHERAKPKKIPISLGTHESEPKRLSESSG